MDPSKKIIDIFSPNKTSAKLFVDFAKKKFGNEISDSDHGESGEDAPMLLLIYDLFIKARSYAILNKIAFNLSFIFGIFVLLWPSISIISHDFGWEKEFLKSAVVQTTITGIAVLTFAIYSHYKKRQVYTENLMRYATFSEDTTLMIIEKVIQEMSRIDTGFSFSQAVFKKTSESDEERSKN